MSTVECRGTSSTVDISIQGLWADGDDSSSSCRRGGALRATPARGDAFPVAAYDAPPPNQGAGYVTR